jgi:Family of unknown function (DUF6516)
MPVEFRAGDRCRILAGVGAGSSWLAGWESPLCDPHQEIAGGLVYIISGRRVLGYDNERGKGDHRHIGEREESFVFSSIEELLARFTAEVEAMRKPE